MITHPNVLRLAREIAASSTTFKLFKDAYLRGDNDNSLIVLVAIAAIERTTALGALWLRTNPDAAHKPHDAFERYDHLRQPEKDKGDAD